MFQLNRFGLRGALPAPISEKHKKLSFKFEADCEPHASLKRMKSDSPGESCAVSLQSSEGHVCCDNDVASESTSAIGAGSILSSRAVTNVSNFVEDYLCDF